MIILFYRNLCFVDHICHKLSPEVQVAVFGISHKILVCSLRVDASHPQDEREDSVWPVTSLLSFLDQNRLHALAIVGVNHMPILVVVVEDLLVTEGTYLLVSVGILVESPHSLFRRLT
jgi:hypothetical protein